VTCSGCLGTTLPSARPDMPGRYRRRLAADSHVYEGYTGAWERKHIEAGIEAIIRKVRDDPSAARKLPEIYTPGCRTVRASTASASSSSSGLASRLRCWTTANSAGPASVYERREKAADDILGTTPLAASELTTQNTSGSLLIRDV